MNKLQRTVIQPAICQQLKSLNSKEKLIIGELAGLSQSFLFACLTSVDCSILSYKKLTDALNIFHKGDYSTTLSDVSIKAIDFKIKLKEANKSQQVAHRIEVEYYVNPELAVKMLKDADNIEDCNDILDSHFQHSGIVGSSSLTRLENE